ncbi:hypothetical protein T484DRAFT_2026975 [Baffinella frigidus]|nr:hypothetical protein T484DRAFT_2026975 [Cryptophyta sp. CCMP2293]
MVKKFMASRGWSGLEDTGAEHCNSRSSETQTEESEGGGGSSTAATNQAAAGKAAIVARRRREKATKIHAWLQESCEIDLEEELTEILDVFVDPMYGVTSMARLFALEETDIDTILLPLSLSTRRLVKKMWLIERPKL